MKGERREMASQHSPEQAFDLDHDGIVTLDEMETAVKRSFSNVKHDIVELKKLHEESISEVGRLKKDIEAFVHKDDLSANAQHIKDAVASLEKRLEDKEAKLLTHMQVLERRMSRLTGLVMEGADLKSRMAGVEKDARDFKGVVDLSPLNRRLHQEVLRMSSDILSLKHIVKAELQDRVREMEERFSRMGDKGRYDSQAFITRQELEGLARQLEKQRGAHHGQLAVQLKTLQERFLQVESLLRQKADLAARLPTVGAEGVEFVTKEEMRKLRSKLVAFEGYIRSEVKKGVAKELARHDQKMTDLAAFLKTRMADHVTGTIRRSELERAVKALTERDEALSRTLEEVRDELLEMRKKASSLDGVRTHLEAVERSLETLRRVKADVTDLTGHNVSRHQFLTHATQIDNHLETIKRKLEGYEQSARDSTTSAKKLDSLSTWLTKLEKQIESQGTFIREIKELVDADLKDLKDVY